MGQKTMILAIVLIIFTVLVSVLLVVSRIHGGSKKADKPVVTQPVNTTLVPVVDIVNSPLVYSGYQVTVESDIIDWVTNKSFTISAGAVGGGGIFNSSQKRQLLVIAKNPFNLPQDPEDGKVGLGEMTKVRVKGQVQILNREQLQKALGVDLDGAEIALDNNNINDWKEGPVIFMNSIEVNTITSK